MKEDRRRWNEKYRRKHYAPNPSDLLSAYWHLATPGRALDIAAGNGRNTLFLAGKGFVVDALDISDVGLRMFAFRHPGVRPVCVDLDVFEIPACRYNLIVNIRFLSRRLFPMIEAGLVPGGLLVFESFLDTGVPGMWRPSRMDYLLRGDELRTAFPGLEILHYREAPDMSYDPQLRMVASLVGIRK